MQRLLIVASAVLFLGCPSERNANTQPAVPLRDEPQESEVSGRGAPPATTSQVLSSWEEATPVRTLELVPGGPAANTTTNAQLTALILRDLEFTLLTWKSLGPDTELWLSGTKTRLNNLRTLAANADLDQNVSNAIEHVDDILTNYDALHRTLRIAEWTDAADREEGKRSLLSVASSVIGSGIEGAGTGLEMGAGGGPQAAAVGAATVGAIAVLGEALGEYGTKLERASKYANLNALKAEFVRREIERSTTYFAERVSDLKRTSRAIAAKRAGLSIPSYELHGDVERYQRSDPASPFPYLMRAYSLIPTNRRGAAAQFAASAGKFPAGSEIYSLHYRGPYLMLAGHLMEFEARHGATRFNQQAAAEAVRYYRAALVELRSMDNMPYPYVISYARALAISGERNAALRLARQLYPRLSAERMVKAARAYDLACVHSLAGDAKRAFELLDESYSAFPRRDPYALEDPQLRHLTNSQEGRQRLQRMCAHPLVGGTWVSTQNGIARYQFFPDGSLWQRRPGTKDLAGFWSTTDSGILRLHGRGASAPDVTVPYRVEPDGLRLVHEGHEFRYRRQNGDLLSGVQGGTDSGRRLSNDGTWVWSDGRAPAGARFSTSRTLSENDVRKFWYSWEDPLAGKLSELRQDRGRS